MVTKSRCGKYFKSIMPYNAGPNLTPVSNCTENENETSHGIGMQYIKFRKNKIFQKEDQCYN